MKVDMRIVPFILEDGGWFPNGKKTMHQLQYAITLTDEEKAIIENAGLREFVIQEIKQHTRDRSYAEIVRHNIGGWCDDDGQSRQFYDTLIEAESYAQQLKANLVRLKEAMNRHTHIGNTEYSFEL